MPQAQHQNISGLVAFRRFFGRRIQNSETRFNEADTSTQRMFAPTSGAGSTTCNGHAFNPDRRRIGPVAEFQIVGRC